MLGLAYWLLRQEIRTWCHCSQGCLGGQGILPEGYGKEHIRTSSTKYTDIETHPRFPTLLPIIQPFTNNKALYGCPSLPATSPKLKDIMTSKPAGILRSKVVTKNPTPAVSLGKPDERSRDIHEDVSKPGRCHPCRSPKRPPSFRTPRNLSGYLEAPHCESGRIDHREFTDMYPVYPPTFP